MTEIIRSGVRSGGSDSGLDVWTGGSRLLSMGSVCGRKGLVGPKPRESIALSKFWESGCRLKKQDINWEDEDSQEKPPQKEIHPDADKQAGITIKEGGGM
ncbi:hypothetical protein RJT34_12711 [Clitoria ternatea]|uniref:Uncharacterized protein n=1 Tax=Clitoria ternatea TaxID=43366 RepID=A0AAN9PJK2_CLITE